MNMIRTETATTITDTCYAQKIAHNKYLPQFFFITTIIHLQSYFVIISIYYQYSFVRRDYI